MLRKRGKTYSVRTFTPADLRDTFGRREVLRTLRTDNPQEARLRAAQWAAHMGTLYAELRKRRRIMSRDQIDALIAQYLEVTFEDIEERLALDSWRDAQPGDPDETWQDFATTRLAEQAEQLEAALVENELASTLDTARAMLPDASEGAQRILARRLVEAQLEATVAEIRAIQGEPLRLGRLAPAAGAHATSSKVATEKLSAVIAAYTAHQRNARAWAPKTDKSVSGILAALLDLIGDRPIGDITKADMRALQALLPRVPAHAQKRYRGMPLREAADAADTANNPERLSAKTCNIYLTWARTLWKWAAIHDMTTDNPTVVLTEFAEADTRDQRGKFTDAQITAILRQVGPERESTPAHYWIPRVMLASGLRLEEAAKLRACDIREEQGVWVFDINSEAGRLKTAHTARLVPIHSALLPNMRTLAAASSNPAGNLWGLRREKGGRWSEQLSKRLNDRIDAAGIVSRKLVTESLRNTFGMKLRAAGVDVTTIKELLGHSVASNEGLAMTARYVGRAELSKLREAIERLPGAAFQVS